MGMDRKTKDKLIYNGGRALYKLTIALLVINIIVALTTCTVIHISKSTGVDVNTMENFRPETNSENNFGSRNKDAFKIKSNNVDTTFVQKDSI